MRDEERRLRGFFWWYFRSIVIISTAFGVTERFPVMEGCLEMREGVEDVNISEWWLLSSIPSAFASFHVGLKDIRLKGHYSSHPILFEPQQ